MKSHIKKLLREGLINEMDMNAYFNSLNSNLINYIKKLNIIYDKFNDYSIMEIMLMDYNQIKLIHNSFDNGVNNISVMINKYDEEIDKLNDFELSQLDNGEYEGGDRPYDSERRSIDIMIELIKEKENMLSDIFYSVRALNDIKDNYDENPFKDIKPINIG